MFRLPQAFDRTDQNKLASLDILRGLAILQVICAHFTGGFIPLWVTLTLGNGGVIVFFFLSGFLMDRNLARDRDIRAYAIRRAFRILPIYWLSILLIVALESRWMPATVASNATFTAPVFGYERLSGVYWTLYVEVLFYIAAPVLRLSGEWAIRLAPYAFLGLQALLWKYRGGINEASFYMLYCFAGMQFGAWYRGQLGSRALAAMLFVISVASSLFFDKTVYFGLIPLISGILLWYALKFSPRYRLLELIGDVSYSWYLLHAIIGYQVLFAMAQTPMPGWFACLCGAVLSLAASIVTFLYVEKPGIEMGKRLIDRLNVTAKTRRPPEQPA